MSDERKNLPSASGMSRIHACRGSFLLEQQANYEPPEELLQEANAGTRIHAFLAGEQVTLTPDEQGVADDCRKIEERIVGQWKGEGEIKTVREQRLWLDDGDGNNCVSGQADVVHIQGTRALVLDWKSGRSVVAPASENWQLSCLAVLVWEAYPEIAEVTVGIIAPRITHDVRACVYDEADLKLARKEVRRLVAEVMQPGQPLTPSEEACKYCKAKLICPALKKEADMIINLPEAKDLSLLTDEDVAIAMDVVGRLTKRCVEVKAESTRRATENPEKWKEFGWILTDGQSRKKVTDVAAVGERLVAQGATWSDVAAASSITMANVKTLARAATGKKGKGLDELVAAVLDGAVESKQTKPTLKRVGDLEDEE